MKSWPVAAASDRWIVVASVTPWSETPRLRHQVTRALAKHYQVLYVQLPSTWRPKYGESWRQPEARILCWRPSNALTPPSRLAVLAPLARRAETTHLRRRLRGLLRSIPGAPVCLVNFSHHYAWLEDHHMFRKCIYICNDDFSAFQPLAYVASAELRQMRKAVAQSDTALATSRALVQRLDGGAKATLFLPAHDLPIRKEPAFRPYRAGEITKVGYMGYIHAHLNYDWIHRAIAEPDLSWHMIGPVSSPDVLQGLSSSARMHIHTPLSGGPLLEWLESMDVLAMPYAASEGWIRGITTPNKLFAYLAAGKPVVASSCLALEPSLSAHIHQAASAEDFLSQIRTARREDNVDAAEARLNLARSNTWEHRIAELLAYLD